ncbi:response regulator [Puia dinghuensis]|uniref:Response regulatory domain-containing protein n=1 Tax=Puia dinghuensis TaxID=1792502 RepID=A0A8J2XTE7_9BACT|nr:response regulator [Puia dinghuensis]GGB03425.1 hypothetical protein GCM10011511_28400 [Puia dinghuensis]
MKKNLVILLVDDCPEIIDRIITLLESECAHLSISAANCFREAIEALTVVTPHLVFLDINLPDRSGIDLLVHIRRSDTRMKIAILTNNSPADYLDICMNLGADFFLDKSSDMERIPTITEEIRRKI